MIRLVLVRKRCALPERWSNVQGKRHFGPISGPLVLCGDHVLDASELLGLGARVRQRILVGLNDPSAGEFAAQMVRAAFGIDEDDKNRRFQDPRGNDTGIAVRTAEESSDQLRRALRRLGRLFTSKCFNCSFIAAVGVISLVRGALVASRQELATLRLSGATPQQTKNILLANIPWWRLWVPQLGWWVAVVLANGLLLFWKHWLPVAIHPGWSWSAAGVGMGVAMFLTLATSYGAISGWAQLSAAACVRNEQPKNSREMWFSFVLMTVALIAYGWWQARSWWMSWPWLVAVSLLVFYCG